MNLNKFAREVHQNAIDHGWYESPPSFPEVIALCHSELSEALDEYRSGHGYIRYECMYPENDCRGRQNCDGCECLNPKGVAVELADCILRVLDYCGREGIDIEAIIREKHEYNKTRPYKHGGKRL